MEKSMINFDQKLIIMFLKTQKLNLNPIMISLAFKLGNIVFFTNAGLENIGWQWDRDLMNIRFIRLLLLLLFINVSIRVSLRALRLILWALKLMNM